MEDDSIKLDTLYKSMYTVIVEDVQKCVCVCVCIKLRVYISDIVSTTSKLVIYNV